MDQASGLFSGSPLRGPVFRPAVAVSVCPHRRAAVGIFREGGQCVQNWAGEGVVLQLVLIPEDRLGVLVVKAFAP